MNLSQFLTKKESISGLAIEDNAVSFMSLRKGGWLKLSHGIIIDSMAVEELPPGTINAGVLSDRPKLVETLRRVIPQKGRGTKFAVLTIPTHEVFITIIPFPAALEEAKFKETVDLAIQYQIPFALEEAYVDWEKIPGTNAMTEVLIAATPKKVVDEYVAACTEAGISIIAVEFHSLSVLRAIPKESLPVFVADAHNESVAAFILANKSLRYQTVIPKREGINIEEEFRRISDFYESKEGVKVRIARLRELAFPLVPQFPKEALEIRGGRWLPVLGAALRGFRPREDDTFISLLAVGTEEAYALNRALSFVQLIRMGMFTFATFLFLIYTGTWLMMVTLQKQSNDQISENVALPEGSEATQVEKSVKEINGVIDAIYNSILQTTYSDKILDEIIAAVPDGIIIQNTQWSTPDAAITLQGVASTREHLDAFKKKLQSSETFTNVVLPLSNLEKKKDIPFSVTFFFTDPTKYLPTP